MYSGKTRLISASSHHDHRQNRSHAHRSHSQDEIAVVRSPFVRNSTDSKESPRINPVSRDKRGRQLESALQTCLRANQAPKQLISVFVHTNTNIDPRTYRSIPKERQKAFAEARTQSPRSGASAGARRLGFAHQARCASSNGFLPPSINNDAKRYSSIPNDSKTIAFTEYRTQDLVRSISIVQERPEVVKDA
jgi:hypothetical protein